ncbi:MAG: hypothetical protein LBL31_07120 [Spirochaetaceae bacterium]|jgi:hypothetical protein|nr:hypothetical protein [Spirochaetaceae bacterium]
MMTVILDKELTGTALLGFLLVVIAALLCGLGNPIDSGFALGISGSLSK